MQPPPRKGKVTTVLKNVHNEQLLKLQMKHQQDSDFLDDIRNFSKMRAIIEKDYAQSLLKLATSHLQKKGPTVQDGKTDDGENSVYVVWKSLLDETEKIAKARLAATEVYQQQVSESAKSVRLYKLQVAKKCFDNLRKMHDEIQVCVTEIDKSKKLYFEEEHMAHDAREKATDADHKLKRKKGRIFQSVSSLQKNSAKFSFRREACDIQATKARNDYVLALLASNAHQSKFYEQDLPELVQYVDCDIYDKVKEYILLMSRTELLTCAACQSSFTIVQEQANKATKQYTMELFFRDNPVLSQPILYDFEPCDNDQINKLSIEHNAALCLSKEARRWISCVTKEVRVIRESKLELKKLLAQLGDKPPFTLQSDQIGPQAELEARVDELRQIIRRSQTSKKKAESRLEAMIEAGVDMEGWMRSSETESIPASESPKENFSRSGTVTSRKSRQSYQSDDVFEGSVEVADAGFYEDSDTAAEMSPAPVANTSMDAEREVYAPDVTSAVDVVAAVQEAWDAAAEEYEPEPEQAPEKPAEALVNGEVPAVGGQKCMALFSYEATNADELSFVEHEELELINEGDGDGWVMARNYRGEEGYIPQNYVELVETQTADSTSRPPLTSFSSVDYTMPDEDEKAGIVADAADDAAAEVPVFESSRPTELPCENRVPVCQAIYDYEATCDEELSFFEGQIIKIIRKSLHDVDDGWWEGEMDGQIGLFPSLVVEELKESGEPITPLTPLSPPSAAPPPDFSPPVCDVPPDFMLPPAEVILTEPTPEMEIPNGLQHKDDTQNMTDAFHAALTKKLQHQDKVSSPDTDPTETHSSEAVEDASVTEEVEAVEEIETAAEVKAAEAKAVDEIEATEEEKAADEVEQVEEIESNADKPAETAPGYAPLESSPESPKEATKIEDVTLEDTSENLNLELATELGPKFVICHISHGDTPISDEEKQITEETDKQDEAEAKDKDEADENLEGTEEKAEEDKAEEEKAEEEKAEEEKAEEVKEEKAEEEKAEEVKEEKAEEVKEEKDEIDKVASDAAASEKIEKVITVQENANSAFPSGDEFECSFANFDEGFAAFNEGQNDPDVKMEVDGNDGGEKDAFGMPVMQNSETTG